MCVNYMRIPFGKRKIGFTNNSMNNINNNYIMYRALVIYIVSQKLFNSLTNSSNNGFKVKLSFNRVQIVRMIVKHIYRTSAALGLIWISLAKLKKEN